MRVVEVPESVLVDAVKTSRSWAEVKRRCGLSLGGAVHVALRRRVASLDLPLEHLGRPVQRYDDAVLRHLVGRCDSVADVLRALGLNQAGGTHAHLSRRIRKLGCDTSHFTRRKHAKAGNGLKLRPEDVLVRRLGAERRRSGEMLTRALIATGRAHVCEGCGTGSIWRGTSLVLSVDHIDGDWTNDEAANLRFLCPNCHSQTPTFCRRSRDWCARGDSNPQVLSDIRT